MRPLIDLKAPKNKIDPWFFAAHIFQPTKPHPIGLETGPLIAMANLTNQAEPDRISVRGRGSWSETDEVRKTHMAAAQVAPVVVAGKSDPEPSSTSDTAHVEETVEALPSKDRHWYAFFKTKDFYIILALGSVCSWCHVLFGMSLDLHGTD